MTDPMDHGPQNFLKVLVQPDLEPEIDIVAVHGLNPLNSPNHAWTTWTHGNGKLWLKDFLPADHPTARVLLFGYNANVAFNASTAGVNEQAYNLLNRLWLKRDAGECTRPIIFIAHSLGGIIVKQALITANMMKNKYNSIRQSTFGIVFFATPHRGGGEFLHLGKLAAKIAKAVHGEQKNDFLANLETDSVFADTRIEEFRDQLDSYRIISFYESIPMSGGLGIIVDKKSAHLGLPTTREDSHPLNLDHRNICKFGTKEDDDYDQVSGNLKYMVTQALKTTSPVPTPSLSRTSSPPMQDPSPRPSAYESFLRGASSPQPTPMDPEAAPYNEEPHLAPRAPELDTGLGINHVAVAMDKISLADTERSLPLSNHSEASLRRQSTATSITSGSTQPTNTTKGKYTQQSPRFFSSFKMNIKNTDGLEFRSAAANGQKDTVMKMLEEGQKIDNSGLWDGFTALADAAVHGQTGIVELLLKHGANPAFNCLHSTSKFGSKHNTPLSLAAGNAHVDTVKVLLEFHEFTGTELNHAYRAAKLYGKSSETLELVKKYGGGGYDS